MSDQRNNQPRKGWVRASASPMHPSAARLMSPGPSLGPPRQRSPTPTFNARQLTETPNPYNPNHQSPTPPLRRPPPTPTGFTTVFESQRFSPAPMRQHPPANVHQPTPSYQGGNVHQPTPSYQNNVQLPPDVSFPRPYRSTFSPTPSAPTPSSLPPFSPPPTPQFMYVDQDRNVKPVSDFYVVPLEPANLNKGIHVYDDEEMRPSTADIIAQQSQDYVDEKLAEYQGVISLLQGESISALKLDRFETQARRSAILQK